MPKEEFERKIENLQVTRDFDLYAFNWLDVPPFRPAAGAELKLEEPACVCEGIMCGFADFFMMAVLNESRKNVNFQLHKLETEFLVRIKRGSKSKALDEEKVQEEVDESVKAFRYAGLGIRCTIWQLEG